MGGYYASCCGAMQKRAHKMHEARQRVDNRCRSRLSRAYDTTAKKQKNYYLKLEQEHTM
jgi:hypothetical protein